MKDAVVETTQCLFDDAESPPVIVREKVSDILKQEHGRTFYRGNGGDVLEERPLRLVIEPVGPAEAVLLRYTGDREGLTGKACGEEIVIGNRGRLDLSDVAVWRLAKPCGVGLLTEPVTLRGEDTAPSGSFKADPQSADSGKEVDEGEAPCGGTLSGPGLGLGWWGAAMTRCRIGWMSLLHAGSVRQFHARAEGRDHRATPGSRSEADYRHCCQAD